ncbi:PCC domain-containing protein [Nocardia sp. NPDC004068]|uniref:PCC domain-containing protein n=1 Tax=Nocardia sp. NPDC004068 TaxID=3364303 RepID=UPI00367CDA71
MYVLEIKNGELLSQIEEQAVAQGIKNAAIVSLIGGVDSFTVSTMPMNDATSDVVSEYAMPAEMHGSGEIVDGSVHIHATMAVQGDRAVAGHVHKANIETWFARAYVIPTDVS